MFIAPLFAAAVIAGWTPAPRPIAGEAARGA
jgi:hypothetical protein